MSVAGVAVLSDDGVLAAARHITALFSGSRLLRPFDLPAELASRAGVFREQPVELSARAWTGLDVAFARIVTISGPGLAIVNVLGLPAWRRAAPDHWDAPTILGVDLVAVAGAPVVVVADLSPVRPGARPAAVDGSNSAGGRLASIRRSRGPFPPGGPLPAWCARWFSPHHLFTRLPPTAVGAASAAAVDFARVWMETAVRARVDRADRPNAHGGSGRFSPEVAAYCADHRAADAGLRLMDRMFGVEWAEAFKRTVLFPEDPATRVGDVP